MIGRACPCGRIHAATEVVAVGRFLPGGPVGYRARHDSRVRPTRNEARRDVCPEWEWEHLHPLAGPPRLTLSRPCPDHEERT